MVFNYSIRRIFLIGIAIYGGLFLDSGNGFILFPNEIQTLSTIFASLIPPISTGVSSKVGFGFRLGRNADFQVLFEVGPQTTTTTTTPLPPTTTTAINEPVDIQDIVIDNTITKRNLRKKRTKLISVNNNIL